ncbi:hypothetical protein JW911_01840 [Candidatus Peregrinibacteria bacterium]|nr:hypothetical protein [Candidatus Peregrinibacteria bacterium]
MSNSKTQNTNKLAKITALFIVFFVIFAGTMQVSAGDTGSGSMPFDDDDPTDPTPGGIPAQEASTKPPSEVKFDVSQYLKIDEGQTYLKDDAKQKGAVGEFIIKLIKLLTTTIGSLALLVIIIGGMTLMISHGNQNLQTKGKEMIKFAILGLIIAFMSLIIVTFVESLFYTV